MSKSKKILFFLATEKGYSVLRKLLENNKKPYIAGVVSFHEIGVQKDFFFDINALCDEYNIPFYEWKCIRDNLASLIKNNCITSCVAISWRFLLPLSLNSILEDKIIVFHDSLLPKYRGWAPLVTALLNGDESVGASVIFASDQADCGEIIMQKSFKLDNSATIQKTIVQMSNIYAELSIDLVNKIVDDKLSSYPQNEDDASYSIWRDEDDYWIDWNWSSNKILRYVKALGFPYKGAKTTVDNKIVRIIDCSEECDVNFAIRNPGKILSLKDGCPVVICGTGLLKIKKALDEFGNVYTFNKLRTRFGGGTSQFLVSFVRSDLALCA